MNEKNANEVSIVDIKMPFWSMVIFMVKMAVAAQVVITSLFQTNWVDGKFYWV